MLQCTRRIEPVMPGFPRSTLASGGQHGRLRQTSDRRRIRRNRRGPGHAARLLRALPHFPRRFRQPEWHQVHVSDSVFDTPEEAEEAARSMAVEQVLAGGGS
ncbi:hypothetical protein [Burkholderia ubonensis]|uniref:hypothetical protein n=1 Tax=Burkholderia ubonensis TaxID=101571 RepID=UPI001E516187|nr:hypothetical protein [Burkholderia ubonensis]